MTGPIYTRASVEPYANIYGHCGEEISSTYEGRHVQVIEENLIHPDHTDPVTGDDFVKKGDPVAFWDGVGVALKTATSLTEAVPIDTEGIWRLCVINSGDMWGDIYVGQTIYIGWDGELTDDIADAMTTFGYALQGIPQDLQGDPVTECIAVKVHWDGMYWLWWYYYISNGNGV
jgi:predicted RecA/RadA family phage recombinase